MPATPLLTILHLYAAISLRRLIVSICAFCLLIPQPGFAQHPQIERNRKAERTNFSDAEITEGFLKIAFGAEFNVAGRIDRIRKYEEPVRIFVDNRAKPDWRPQIAKVVADIRAHIHGLDIAVTQQRAQANVILIMARDRDLGHIIRTVYGRERARQIQKSLEPQCLSGFSKDETFRIISSSVLIAADAGRFVFYDCIYEELLQALGPINDDSSVPWTMFNDDVQKGFFDIYDQYLLNILYHPRVRAGMTREEVRALLPEILPEIREWIGKVNRPSR